MRSITPTGSTASTRTGDTAQIERLFIDFLAAWTAGDAESFGALFTDDSDYVSYDGTIARGPPRAPAQPRQALPRRPGRLGAGR
ncbi:hypothetical protein [Nonomuraea dietziae]|uniref:hypothetical protein n=1 Tax=Nonomuraea dietziae TaxID=65515 RepID=UPI0031D9B587